MRALLLQGQAQERPIIRLGVTWQEHWAAEQMLEFVYSERLAAGSPEALLQLLVLGSRYLVGGLVRAVCARICTLLRSSVANAKTQSLAAAAACSPGAIPTADWRLVHGVLQLPQRIAQVPCVARAGAACHDVVAACYGPLGEAWRGGRTVQQHFVGLPFAAVEHLLGRDSLRVGPLSAPASPALRCRPSPPALPAPAGCRV